MLYDLKKALFIDCDLKYEVALKQVIGHLERNSDHSGFVRKSCSGNLHGIIFNHCANCNLELPTDSHYTGKRLFNNKGNKWADPIWINPITEQQIDINAIDIVQISIIPYSGSVITHYYIPMKYLHKHLSTITIDTKEHPDIFYCFHSVIWREGECEEFTNSDSRFTDFSIEEFNAIQRDTLDITQIQQDYQLFCKTKPEAFK